MHLIGRCWSKESRSREAVGLKRTGSKIVCMILMVFLLMLGMCQSKVGADFLFSYASNGQMEATLASPEQWMDTAEIEASELSAAKNAVLTAGAVSREEGRVVSRFFMNFIAAMLVLTEVYVTLRTAQREPCPEESSAGVILCYLHAKDGKK